MKRIDLQMTWSDTLDLKFSLNTLLIYQLQKKVAKEETLEEMSGENRMLLQTIKLACVEGCSMDREKRLIS